MKILIQRVIHSSVKVNEEVISKIGRGLLVFVGIHKNDTKEDIEYVSRKILNLRLFEDENGKKWAKSVTEKEYEIMCVSQFTLCNTFKGNRLDFHNAMNPDDSQKFYENFLEALQKQYKPHLIKDGKFGAYMQVELCNDGPVTIHLVSPREEKQSHEIQKDSNSQIQGL